MVEFNGTDPFGTAEHEMKAAGFDLDRIPQNLHDQHIWSDGFLLFWCNHGRLPTSEELAEEMFDEWDDPVSLDETEEVLKFLNS